jgi:phage shock protein A
MQQKIKALEKLVTQACAQIKKFEKENAELKLQVKSLSSDISNLQIGKNELKKIKTWQANVKTRLAKLSSKIKSAIDKS